MPHPLTRRSFLKATAGAGAMASFATTTGARRRAVEPPPEGWFDQPMRWVQLTLVENDPGRFDPAFWLDYFRRLHADAATLSAGGIVAYYPTEVPLHHRSAWLGDTDPFGTLAAGCRAQGMRVVARTDPHAVRDEVRAAHPDWIAVNADGSPRRHWANKDLWVTCALGPVQLRLHGRGAPRDRVEVPAWTASSPTAGRRRAATASACTAHGTSGRRPGRICRARMRPPRPGARFVEWRTARLTTLWKHWDATVRSANPAARFIPNGPPDLKTAGELADIQFTDNQARRGLTPPWANGHRAKEYRSVMGRRADRRHLQRRRGRAVPLEGLRAERAGDPAVGGRGHGQWHAAVGHEILRRPLRPPLAARRRADLRLAFPSRAVPAQRGACRASGAALLGTDRDVSRGRGAHRPCGRPRPGDVSRAGRIARALRTGARGLPDRRKPRPVQAAHPGRRRGPLERAVRRHPPVRGAWRQPAGDLRLVALRRGRRAAARTSGCPMSSACRFPDVSTGRCRTRISASTPTPARAGGTPSSTASATRPASSTGCSGSTCSRAKTGRRP